MDLKSKIGLYAVLLILKSGPILATILRCDSPQYVVLHEEGIVECQFPGEFTAIVWYDSPNVEQARVTRLEKQQNGFTASGDGYESGSYDILSNGSLIIPLVTINHERSFKVILVDNISTVSEKIITLVTVVHPGQFIPEVSSCEAEVLCLSSSMEKGSLICNLNQARPAVSLSWYRFNDGEEIALDAQTNVTTDGQYTFTSTSVLNVSQFITNTLTVLSCRASGPAVGFRRAATNVILYSTHTNSEKSQNADLPERTVAVNSTVMIPCTERRTPMAFVWSFEMHDVSNILAFSAQGEKKLINNLSHTFDVLLDGTIIFRRVNNLLEGVLTCAFLEDGESSFFEIRLNVVDDSNRTLKIAIIIFILVLAVVSGVFIIIIYRVKKSKPTSLLLKKRNPAEVCEDVADALLNWPFVLENDTSLFSEDAINLLENLSEKAIQNKRSNDQAAITGVGFGVAGGATALVGTVLLPFTLGAGSLIVTGATVGLTGTAVSTAYALDKSQNDRKRFQKAKPSLETFVEIHKNLSISIGHIVNAYEIIDLYVSNEEDIGDQKLETKVDKMKQLLTDIHVSQKSRTDTAEEKIRDVKKFSRKLVETLLEGTDESEHSFSNIFKERRGVFDMTEKGAFDTLAKNVIKLINHNNLNTQVFTFCTLIHNLYVSDFHATTNLKDERNLLDNVEKAALTGATTMACRAGYKLLNASDDVAKVGANVAKVAKGVAVAGTSLNVFGIVLDFAFLGKAIEDIKKDEAEELPKAFRDTAEMMKEMNEIIRQGATPETVELSC